jgi:hypothetical protein
MLCCYDFWVGEVDGREAYMAISPEAKQLIAAARAVAAQLTQQEPLEEAEWPSAIAC